jgi:hypothetical protein
MRMYAYKDMDSPFFCIGCVVGNSQKESELKEFRKWKQDQHALDLQRFN